MQDMQDYKAVIRGGYSIVDIQRNKTISIRKITSYSDEVYISDKVNIKPRALHSIKSNTDKALKEWKIQSERKPKIIIVSPDELPAAYETGRKFQK